MVHRHLHCSSLSSYASLQAKIPNLKTTVIPRSSPSSRRSNACLRARVSALSSLSRSRARSRWMRETKWKEGNGEIDQATKAQDPASCHCLPSPRRHPRHPPESVPICRVEPGNWGRLSRFLSERTGSHGHPRSAKTLPRNPIADAGPTGPAIRRRDGPPRPASHASGLG